MLTEAFSPILKCSIDAVVESIQGDISYLVKSTISVSLHCLNYHLGKNMCLLGGVLGLLWYG